MVKRVYWLAILAMLLLHSHTDAQILYGISNGFGTAANNQIYQIDASSGTISNAFQVTVPGQTVLRSMALAAQPGTGTLFAVVQFQGQNADNRNLITIDPNTGVGTNIGNLGRAFASLSFRSDGNLWGVTGDGSTQDPESLFIINTATAGITFQFALGNGADGETIAFHPNGLLYHSSGNGAALFESVDVDTQNVIPIGSASGEMFAMGYHPDLNQLLGSDINNNFFSIDIATGNRTSIGTINAPSDNRGLAFVASAVPEPTTMVLAGFAGVTGVAFGWKRRKRSTKAKLAKQTSSK